MWPNLADNAYGRAGRRHDAEDVWGKKYEPVEIKSIAIRIGDMEHHEGVDECQNITKGGAEDRSMAYLLE